LTFQPQNISTLLFSSNPAQASCLASSQNNNAMAVYNWRSLIVALLGSTAFAATVPLSPPPNLIPRQAPGTPSVEVQQLVAGLGFNIMAQKGEMAVASIMQSLLQTPTPNPALFTVAKVCSLLSH
jgi:hypothetical protein